MTVWLSRPLIVGIHDEQLRALGGAPGVRDVGLLESAPARSLNRAGYGEPDTAELAAICALRIIGNHPFIDGNKRTGYVALETFLALNGLRFPVSDADAAGATDKIARLVGQIRARRPKMRVLLRADSGFCRDAPMTSAEENQVDHVLGLARNARLVDQITAALQAARAEAEATGKPARRFADFRWRTRESWGRERRAIGKAEWTQGEANPRFIVTSLAPAEVEDAARHLYERVYCARGEMENRIKECQLDLFADRTSSATMRANQLRLWFSSLAYVL